MLKFGKRPFPMIGKLSELLVSGNRAIGFFDVGASPRSPLDLKMQSPSPRGLKNHDLGGVGLGIVAALEKSSHKNGCEVLAKYAVCYPNLNRSNPIPVTSGQNCDGFSTRGLQEFEEDSLENYTYVTLHGQNKSCTKVYYDGGESRRSGVHHHHHVDEDDLHTCNSSIGSEFPTSDFLSSCHLCRKKLHGKDIYMYRGEMAFCSTECRATQMIVDERKERCRSEASRSVDVSSSSSCSRDQIFSTGILVI